jgi:enterochelin esterase-like enzyme
MLARRSSAALVAVVALICLTAAVATVWAQAPDSGGAPSPDVEVRQLHSNALRGTEHLAVHLPKGYRPAAKRRYPVIYFLHGLPGNATSYNGPRIRRLGDSVERSGRQAIVVGIQGARRGDTDPEWHDWGRGRDWETAAAVEAVRYVDRHYRTISNRSGRALIGLSAGGYGATLIGFHRPQTYSVIESWSGYFHPTTPDGDGPLDLGDYRANRLASAHAYVRRALGLYTRHPTFLGFYVGDRDARFQKENEQLDRELTRARVPHSFAVYPGAHSGWFWDQHEDDWIVTALDHLAPSH